jgi:purine-cytosine permease-like protein
VGLLAAVLATAGCSAMNTSTAHSIAGLPPSIPMPFLVVLMFWLCIIFASFGHFAPRNATVIAVLCVCALSVSGAIFLILELDRSFEGLLQVPGTPLRTALAQLSR